MALGDRPTTDEVRWAHDGSTLQSDYVTTPTSANKDEGFPPGSQPPAGWLDYVLVGLYKWIYYLANTALSTDWNIAPADGFIDTTGETESWQIHGSAATGDANATFTSGRYWQASSASVVAFPIVIPVGTTIDQIVVWLDENSVSSAITCDLFKEVGSTLTQAATLATGTSTGDGSANNVTLTPSGGYVAEDDHAFVCSVQLAANTQRVHFIEVTCRRQRFAARKLESGGIGSRISGYTEFFVPLDVGEGTVINEINLMVLEADSETATFKLWEYTDGTGATQIGDSITTGTTGGEDEHRWADGVNDTGGDFPYTVASRVRLMLEVNLPPTTTDDELVLENINIVRE